MVRMTYAGIPMGNLLWDQKEKKDKLKIKEKTS